MNENCVFCLGIMKEHNYRAPIKGKAPAPHAFLNIFADLFRASEAIRDWCSIHQILTINWTIGALLENFVEPKSRGRHCLLDSDMTVKLPNQNLKPLIFNKTDVSKNFLNENDNAYFWWEISIFWCVNLIL